MSGQNRIVVQYDFEDMVLLGAFETSSGNSVDVQTELYKNKLIVLSCGTQSIRFRPHLNVTKVDLEKALSIIEIVLNETSL